MSAQEAQRNARRNYTHTLTLSITDRNSFTCRDLVLPCTRNEHIVVVTTCGMGATQLKPQELRGQQDRVTSLYRVSVSSRARVSRVQLVSTALIG